MTEKKAKEPTAKKAKPALKAKEEPIKKPKTEVKTAKAGKRSIKAIEASEAKLTKQQNKLAKSEVVVETKKDSNKPTRTRLERRSKSYKQHYKELDITKRYTPEEATKLIITTNPVKFDATVELHVRLAVDPRQADQNIRDNVLLPAGSGKTVRIAAFVDGDNIEIAKTAGADLVGESEIIKELTAGSFSFDVLVATPSQMPKLGKYARILGPRGLMPNPKSGTVTVDIAKAISESKAGKVEYRVDSGGIVHVGIGKVSFKPAQLLENLETVLSSIQANKPSSIKATYIISAYLTTSMGPSIKLAL